MKKLVALLLCLLLLSGCVAVSEHPTTKPSSQPTEQTTVFTEPTTVPTEPPETQPTEPPLNPMGYGAEDVIAWFGEVCLDAEFINSGNASLLQKWQSPISYTVYGTPTPEDTAILERFCDWLNQVEGFPGIAPTVNPWEEDIAIYFCSEAEMLERLGGNFYGCDGGVTFWYNGDNAIYDATICVRNDILQEVRNSVILEELYNGLGPMQDTNLREDSLIWSGYSEPQWLTPADELILRLLYHPSLECGMTADQVASAIRTLLEQ